MLSTKNYAISQIGSDITGVSTTITLPSVDADKFPTSLFRLTVWGIGYEKPSDDPTAEIMECTRSGSILTIVTRALEGTQEINHPTGSYCGLFLTAGLIDELQALIASSVLPSMSGQSGKFLTNNGVISSWGTVITPTSTDTLSNKTLDNTTVANIKDTSFTLESAAAATKKAQFLLSSITAGQTRIFTLPDLNDTLVTLSAVQTLLNKTLTNPVIVNPDIMDWNGWQPITVTLTPRGQAYTNDPAAGSNIVLNMTDTSNFEVADIVTVSSSAGSEDATITSVAANTSITVNTLALNHTTTSPLVRHATTNKTFVLTTSVDLTGTVGVGDKVMITQSATVKYGIIVAITSTKVTVYGGTDYSFTGSAALSDLHISHGKSPSGFPLNPLKWDLSASDLTERLKSSPAQNVWYNDPSGTSPLSLTVPIGGWSLEYQGYIMGSKASTTDIIVVSTLSTANNSESDADFTIQGYLGSATGTLILAAPVFRQKSVLLTSKTPYYLNIRTTAVSMATVRRGMMIVKARCNYL